MLRKCVVVLVSLLLWNGLNAQKLTTYAYPSNEGEALLSDKYELYVRLGDGEEQKLDVLMSEASWQGDYMGTELKGRTFSFASLSYNYVGDTLWVRVVKIFGTASSAVSAHPRLYGLELEHDPSGMEVTFPLTTNNRYISIDFNGSDNRTTGHSWIKHMFCLFVDPVEVGAPSKTGSGVVVYSDDVAASSIANAKIIYFPSGYHNLQNYQNGGSIATDGMITIKTNQSIYLEGGAFVEGVVNRTDYNDRNQKIYGRGILTGRQYMWHNHPEHTGTTYNEIVRLGKDATVEGVTIIESPSHGIVSNNTLINNVKMLGWHCNNDCVRVGSKSEIKNSFFRAVDDHFYNFDIYVHDVVLWAGHNGSILTYGWGGTGGNTYNAGGSLLENIDIIHPEWTGLGNNNGLIMSQVGCDFKPYGYGGDAKTVIRDIRIEGSIPGITNLKPRSGGNGEIIAQEVANGSVGFIGDLLLENITVDGQFGKGLLKGMVNASSDGTTCYVKEIAFNNVKIAGRLLTLSNSAQFFNIEAATTKNISFNGEVDNGIDPDKIMRIEAEDYHTKWGVSVQDCEDNDGGENLYNITNFNWSEYKVECDAGTYEATFRVATAYAGGYIKVNVNGQYIGKVLVDQSKTDGFQEWYTTEAITLNLGTYNNIRLEY